MGRVNWYSGRVNSSGWRRRVGRVCARGQTPCRRVMESAAMSDVRFWRRFHRWLRLFLLYTVVWSKHNCNNFHFWAKIKHPFKPSALIPIVGKSDRGCTDNCSKGRGSILTQYLTWFGKTAYIHGRESILFRDREKGLQHIWRRRITSLSPLPALNCCACSCCNGSKAAAIAALFLSTLLHTLTFSLLSFCSHIMPLFIGISWQLFLLCCQHWWLPNSSSFNNGGCQLLFFNNGGCQ